MQRRSFVPGAVVLVVLLTAACGSSPAAASPPKPVLSAADRAEVAALEARPLHLPTLLPDGTCRPDDTDPTSGQYGIDPVFLHGGPHYATPFGDYNDVGALTHVGMVGPVLIRAHDLKVANHPVVFLSSYVEAPLFVHGPMLGADPRFGPQYTELVIDTAYKTATVTTLSSGSYYEWGWRQGIAAGWSGCIGFQVDGPGFSFDINVNDPAHD